MRRTAAVSRPCRWIPRGACCLINRAHRKVSDRPGRCLIIRTPWRLCFWWLVCLPLRTSQNVAEGLLQGQERPLHPPLEASPDRSRSGLPRPGFPSSSRTDPGFPAAVPASPSPPAAARRRPAAATRACGPASRDDESGGSLLGVCFPASSSRRTDFATGSRASVTR
jgi:hypothetical protein